MALHKLEAVPNDGARMFVEQDQPGQVIYGAGVLWTTNLAGCLGVAVRRGRVLGMAHVAPRLGNRREIIETLVERVMDHNPSPVIDVVVAGCFGTGGDRVGILLDALEAHRGGNNITLYDETGRHPFAEAAEDRGAHFDRRVGNLRHTGFVAVSANAEQYMVHTTTPAGVHNAPNADGGGAAGGGRGCCVIM